MPRGLPLSEADRATITEQLQLIFPVSERIEGILFDGFESNRDMNRGYPLAAIMAPTLVGTRRTAPARPTQLLRQWQHKSRALGC